MKTINFSFTIHGEDVVKVHKEVFALLNKFEKEGKVLISFRTSDYKFEEKDTNKK